MISSSPSGGFIWAMLMIASFRCTATAHDSKDLSNCVDRCVHSFLAQVGREHTVEEYRSVVERLGFDLEAKNRNLLECKVLLEAFGVKTRISSFGVSSFPAILFIPNENPSDVGHVILLARRLADGVIVGVDPGAAEESVFLNESHLNDSNPGFVLLQRAGLLGYCFDLQFMAIWIVAVVFCAFLAFKVLKRRRRQISLLILSSFVLVAGCRDNQQKIELRVVVDREDVDFGVIDDGLGDQQKRKIVKHDFLLTNNSTSAIMVQAVSTSCACVVLLDGGGERTLEPMGELSIPISLNLDRKTGEFREKIMLRLHDKASSDSVLFRTLSLHGFVQHKPATSALVELFHDGSHQASGQAVISYLRLKDSSEIVLEGTELRSPSGAFEVGKAVYEKRLAGSDSVVDVWTFPVKYQGIETAKEDEAELFVSWSNPMCSSSVVLRSRMISAIKLLERDYFLSGLRVGETHIEKIPIEVNLPELARACKEVDLDDIKVSVDLEKSELVIMITPRQTGECTWPIELRMGEETLPLRIFANVRDK